VRFGCKEQTVEKFFNIWVSPVRPVRFWMAGGGIHLHSYVITMDKSGIGNQRNDSMPCA